MAGRTPDPETCVPHDETAPCWQAGRRVVGISVRPQVAAVVRSANVSGGAPWASSTRQTTRRSSSRRPPRGRLSPLSGRIRTNLNRVVANLDVRARGCAVVDRPSALDLAFLDLETPQAPMHVGWTLRFGAGPGAAVGAPSLAALRRHLDARLDAVPRFRRRLAPAGPLGRGGPAWIDDPAFDLARHVFAVSLPAPGATEQ